MPDISPEMLLAIRLLKTDEGERIAAVLRAGSNGEPRKAALQRYRTLLALVDPNASDRYAAAVFSEFERLGSESGPVDGPPSQEDYYRQLSADPQFCRLVGQQFPSPLALPFRIAEAVDHVGPGERAAAIQILMRRVMWLLASIHVSAYARSGASNHKCDDLIAESFFGDSPCSDGGCAAVLGALGFCAGAWASALPNTAWAFVLYDEGRRPTPAFHALYRYIELRNAYCHTHAYPDGMARDFAGAPGSPGEAFGPALAFLKGVDFLAKCRLVIPLERQGGFFTRVIDFSSFVDERRYWNLRVDARIPLSAEIVCGTTPILCVRGDDTSYATLSPFLSGLVQSQSHPSALFSADLCILTRVQSDGDELHECRFVALGPQSELTVNASINEQPIWFQRVDELRRDIQARRRVSSVAETTRSIEKADLPRIQFQGCRAADGHDYLLQYAGGVFGREQELEELDRWAAAGDQAPAVFCLTGWGGRGKSCLAWEWFSNPGHAPSVLEAVEYEQAMWCSFYVPNFGLPEFVREAIKQLTGKRDHDLQNRDEQSLLDELESILKGRKVLFVLDGLERRLRWYRVRSDYPQGVDPPREAREFALQMDRRILQTLIKASIGKFVLTSRLPLRDLEQDGLLERVRVHELAGIGPEGALRLWRQTVPSDQTPDAHLSAMFARIDRHAIGISLFARCVQDAGTLANWRRLVPGHTALDADFDGTIEQRISEIVGYAVNSPGLDAQCRELLKVLYGEKRAKTYDDLVDIFKARGVAEDVLRRAVADLRERAIIGCDQSCRRFELHPVVRTFVWNHLNLGKPAKESASIKRQDQQRTVPGDIQEYIDTVVQQLDARKSEHAWRLIDDHIFDLLIADLQGGRAILVDLMQRILPVAAGGRTSLPVFADRKEQARFLYRYAHVLSEFGKSDVAMRYRRWACAIYFQLGMDWQYTLGRRGNVWDLMYAGRLESAVSELCESMVPSGQFFLDGLIAFECEGQFWLAMIGAMDGQPELTDSLLQTLGRDSTGFDRWHLQTLAEACLYLGRTDEAIRLIDLAQKLVCNADRNRPQRAWEEWTRGAAMIDAAAARGSSLVLDDLREAMSRLDSARSIGEHDGYQILHTLAMVYLVRANVLAQHDAEVEDLIARLSDNEYAGNYAIVRCEHHLSKAEYSMHRARKLRPGREQRERVDEAVLEAERAIQAATEAGDGYWYESGINKAVQFARDLGRQIGPGEPLPRRVPRGCVLARFKELGIDASIQFRNRRRVTRARITEFEDIIRSVRAAARPPASELLGSIRDAFGEDFEQLILWRIHSLGCTADEYHAAYANAEVRSPAGIIAAMLIRKASAGPEAKARPLVEVISRDHSTWRTAVQSARSNLGVDSWLGTSHAARLQDVIKGGQLEEAEVRMFRDDAVRRLGYQDLPQLAPARLWWEAVQREHMSSRAPVAYLLAEAITSVGLTLAEFVTHLDYPNPRCVELAFAKVSLERARRQVASAYIANTDTWTDEEVDRRLEEVKWQIGWLQTTGSARKWWQAFENENKHRWKLVLRLTEEILKRHSTITDFFLAYVYSNTDNIQANLHYLDYTVRKKEAAKQAADTTAKDGGVPASERLLAIWTCHLLDQPRYQGVQDPSNLSPEAFAEAIRMGLEALGGVQRGESAGKWWSKLEETYSTRPDVLLRFVEELVVRKATLGEGFLAYVYSNTENLRAVLDYFDYSRLKKEEEAKKRAVAVEAEKQRAIDLAHAIAALTPMLGDTRIREPDGELTLSDSDRLLLSKHPPSGLAAAEQATVERELRAWDSARAARRLQELQQMERNKRAAEAIVGRLLGQLEAKKPISPLSAEEEQLLRRHPPLHLPEAMWVAVCTAMSPAGRLMMLQERDLRRLEGPGKSKPGDAETDDQEDK